ncbi:Neurotransmitter-gated ion-channel transmembrane region [Mactra antiquata]
MAALCGKTLSMKYFLIISLYIHALIVQVVNISFEDTRDVHEAVIRYYLNGNKPLRKLLPVEDQSQPIDVFLTFYLYSLDEFDPETGKLELTGSVSAEWMDETSSTSIGNYSFNDAQQGHTVFLPSDVLWTPNIRLTNGAARLKKSFKSYLLRYNVYDGRILWQLKFKMVVTCKPEVKYFPFDTHECCLIFAADDNTAVESVQPDVNVLDYTPNNLWKILSIETEDVNTNSENSIKIYFRIQRKSLITLVIFNFILPVILINVLSGCVFLLPVKTARRLHFSIGCFLSVVFLLRTIFKTLPQSGDPVPSLCYFVLIMFVSNVVTFIVTILISHMSVKTSTVPLFIKKLTIFVNYVTCKNHCRKETSSLDYNLPIPDHEASPVVKPSDNTLRMSDFTSIRPHTRMTLASRLSVTTFASSTQDNVGVANDCNDSITWFDVTCAMDRFFFVFFVFIHCLISLVFILVVSINGD